MSDEPYRHVHPYTKAAQGLLSDYGFGPFESDPELWVRHMDVMLTRATEAAKDVEAERDRLRAALERIWVMAPDTEGFSEAVRVAGDALEPRP